MNTKPELAWDTRVRVHVASQWQHSSWDEQGQKFWQQQQKCHCCDYLPCSQHHMSALQTQTLMTLASSISNLGPGVSCLSNIKSYGEASAGMNSWACTFVREVRVLEADSCTICWGVCLSVCLKESWTRYMGVLTVTNTPFNGDGAGAILGPLSCLRKFALHPLGGRGWISPGVCKHFL